MPQFKIGDVVQLKSGGPVMTVSKLRQNGDCGCDWFVSNQKHSGIFNPETLREYRDQQSGGESFTPGGPDDWTR